MMIASLVLAVFLPVELLILSYAFLGPLHYLTEINWLEDKNFYVKGKAKKWAWVLVGLTLCLILPPTIEELISNGFLGQDSFKNITSFLGDNYELFLFLGLILSLILVFTEKTIFIIISFLLVLVGIFFIYNPEKPFSSLENVPMFYFIFGIFLPTIIHVYLFTALFMFYGALKGKSKLGIFSVVLLFAIPFFIFNMDLIPGSYEITEYGNRALRDSNFAGLNQYFAHFFGIKLDQGSAVVLSEISDETSKIPQMPIHLKTQVFIAFAYIYHYLNWFSKTTIIKWHKSLSMKRLYIMGATYIIAIGLYIYNYKVGFIAMFFLSFLHVLLEFPLNVVSIRGIGQELGKRMGFGQGS